MSSESQFLWKETKLFSRYLRTDFCSLSCVMHKDSVLHTSSLHNFEPGWRATDDVLPELEIVLERNNHCEHPVAAASGLERRPIHHSCWHPRTIQNGMQVELPSWPPIHSANCHDFPMTLQHNRTQKPASDSGMGQITRTSPWRNRRQRCSTVVWLLPVCPDLAVWITKS